MQTSANNSTPDKPSAAKIQQKKRESNAGANPTPVPKNKLKNDNCRLAKTEPTDNWHSLQAHVAGSFWLIINSRVVPVLFRVFFAVCVLYIRPSHWL